MREEINLINYFYNKEEVISIALGGSRARLTNKIDSDFDLFVVLTEEAFEGEFYKNIDKKLVLDGIFQLSCYMFYQENWGYLHKGIDFKGVRYDISYMPLNRIKELGIKSTNKIYFDKNGIYSEMISKANDDINEQIVIAQNNELNVKNKILFDAIDYLKSKKNNQYWEQVKYLERIRRNLMILKRISLTKINKHHFSPEKNYEIDTKDFRLKRIYKFGNKHVLKRTFKKLLKMYFEMLLDEEIKLVNELLGDIKL